ncbi:MAG TPA: hypothetical protein VFD91_11495, partial [Mariniphaga sp.]|nr:hypothetical protein [Mariniphaga sp.]
MRSFIYSELVSPKGVLWTASSLDQEISKQVVTLSVSKCDRLRQAQTDRLIKIKQLLFLISSFVILTSYITNAQIAVSGDTIYTMAGEKIVNGVILIKDDKIEKVGLQSEIEIPADYKIVKGKVVTPGLIDAHSVVGLSGIYNYAHDQDQLEKSDAIQPELRAFDA